MSVNQITLIGNMGKEIRMGGNEANPICNLSLATNHEYKNRDGQKVSETEWHRVVLFGQNAKFASEYAGSGGRQVYVQGRLRTRKFTKDGVERQVTEVVAESFQFMGPNPNPNRASDAAPVRQEQAHLSAASRSESASTARPATPAVASVADLDRDIPF